MTKHARFIRDYDKNTPEFRCGFQRCLVAMNEAGSRNIMPSIADRKEFPNVSWKLFVMGWCAAQRVED